MRRDFGIPPALAALAALALTACGQSQGPANPQAISSAIESTASSSLSATAANSPTELVSADGTLDVTLTAAESQVPYQGTTRWAMTYNGAAAGPTLRVRPGDHLTITVVNELDKATNLHTHGLHVSPEGTSDNPFIMIEPGQKYTYAYDIPVDQQPGTFWYHPHMHGLTAEQVASGLSGAIIVENSVDDALRKVSTDDVLVLNDPPLTQVNPWASSAGTAMGGMDHSQMGMGGAGSSGVDMMTAMTGRTGPRLLANGADGVDLTPVAGKLQRVHVVNATASTRLAVSWTGARMLRLASEGGRLPTAEEVNDVVLSPGERTELVLVPGDKSAQLTAQRLSNEGSGAALGLPEVIARVPQGSSTDTSHLPTEINQPPRNLFGPDVTIADQRVITLDGHMHPTIDGKPFDPNTINFLAKKGTVEEWVIRNKTPMFHPIHLHTWGFQVKDEQGWQDVVMVPPNDSMTIRVAYDDFAGTTVIHCHILDHEDTGMMAIIRVA